MHIKDNTKDSFNSQNKDLNYFNGNVEVIIPGKKSNWNFIKFFNFY